MPDFVGIVLHPPGSREVLGQLAVGHVDHRGPVVHHQRPYTGGAGIDGDGHRRSRGHGGTVVIDRAPTEVLAESNHLQFFANALPSGYLFRPCQQELARIR